MKIKIFKNPLTPVIFGGIVQWLLLYLSYITLDDGSFDRFFRPRLAFWDVIWLAAILLSIFIPQSKILQTFKRSILIAVAVPIIIFVFAGITCDETSFIRCSITENEQEHEHDYIINATTDTWIVATDLASGERQANILPPGWFSPGIFKDFRSGLITNIIVRLQDSITNKYTLSVAEISKARRASRGELQLVIYMDGIACIPPTIVEPRDHYDPHDDPYDSQTLQDRKDEVLEWTRAALSDRN